MNYSFLTRRWKRSQSNQFRHQEPHDVFMGSRDPSWQVYRGKVHLQPALINEVRASRGGLTVFNKLTTSSSPIAC